MILRVHALFALRAGVLFLPLPLTFFVLLAACAEDVVVFDRTKELLLPFFGRFGPMKNSRNSSKSETARA